MKYKTGQSFTIDGARIERHTAIHRHTSARILTICIEQGGLTGNMATGFAVSGDMIAVIRWGSKLAAERRRRRAAAVISEAEARHDLV